MNNCKMEDKTTQPALHRWTKASRNAILYDAFVYNPAARAGKGEAMKRTLLLLCTLLLMLPLYALGDMTEELAEDPQVFTDAPVDNTAQHTAYANQVMGLTRSRLFAAKSGGIWLTGTDRKAYDVFCQAFRDIAAGNRDSSKVIVTLNDLGIQAPVLYAEDFGMESLVDEDGQPIEWDTVKQLYWDVQGYTRTHLIEIARVALRDMPR